MSWKHNALYFETKDMVMLYRKLSAIQSRVKYVLSDLDIVEGWNLGIQPQDNPNTKFLKDK